MIIYDYDYIILFMIMIIFFQMCYRGMIVEFKKEHFSPITNIIINADCIILFQSQKLSYIIGNTLNSLIDF